MVVAVEIDSLPTRKLRKQVGQKTFAAGCRYYSSGRVTEAHREGDWIVGTVTGSGHEDYQVRIQLSAKSGTLLKAESTCTYTSGYGKHEVALALAALADPTLRLAESAGWGGLLDQAEEVAREFTSNGEQEERLVVRLWLPMTPDDAPRVRLFKVRYGKKGRGAERPLQHWQLKAALDGVSKGGIGKLQEGIGKFLLGGICAVATDGDVVRLSPFGRRLGCLLLLLLFLRFALLVSVLGQVHGAGTPPLLVRSIFGSGGDFIKVLGVRPHPLHLVTVALSPLNHILGIGLEPLGLSLPLLSLLPLLVAFVELLLGLELLVRDAQRQGLGLQLGLPLVTFVDVGTGCHGGLLCRVGKQLVGWRE